MHHRQDRQMVIRAVQMAVWQRQGSDPVILHSDRGSQFRSGDYQRYLAANELVCSMSAVGHCGDNAACEGFFGLLKRARIHRMTYPTPDAARADVFEIHRAVAQPEDAAQGRQARPEAVSSFTTVRDFGVEPDPRSARCRTRRAQQRKSFPASKIHAESHALIADARCRRPPCRAGASPGTSGPLRSSRLPREDGRDPQQAGPRLPRPHRRRRGRSMPEKRVRVPAGSLDVQPSPASRLKTST